MNTSKEVTSVWPDTIVMVDNSRIRSIVKEQLTKMGRSEYNEADKVQEESGFYVLVHEALESVRMCTRDEYVAVLAEEIKAYESPPPGISVTDFVEFFKAHASEEEIRAFELRLKVLRSVLDNVKEDNNPRWGAFVHQVKFPIGEIPSGYDFPQWRIVMFTDKVLPLSDDGVLSILGHELAHVYINLIGGYKVHQFGYAIDDRLLADTVSEHIFGIKPSRL